METRQPLFLFLSISMGINRLPSLPCEPTKILATMAYRSLPNFYPQPCVAAHPVICFPHLFAPLTPRLLFQGQVRVIDMNHQMYGAVLTVDSSLTRLIVSFLFGLSSFGPSLSYQPGRRLGLLYRVAGQYSQQERPDVQQESYDFCTCPTDTRRTS